MTREPQSISDDLVCIAPVLISEDGNCHTYLVAEGVEINVYPYERRAKAKGEWTQNPITGKVSDWTWAMLSQARYESDAIIAAINKLPGTEWHYVPYTGPKEKRFVGSLEWEHATEPRWRCIEFYRDAPTEVKGGGPRYTEDLAPVAKEFTDAADALRRHSLLYLYDREPGRTQKPSR